MTSVYIIADIEGSTGCLSKDDSRLFIRNRYAVCKSLTKDLNAVCDKLFENNVKRIRIKDFHRTGYNILKPILDKRVELDQGFKSGPIPGIGEANGFDYLMMIGLHSASGTDGFLPHTLTSQIAKITVNGKILTEAELFASSLAECNIVPVFFSGCSDACKQAKDAIKDITTFSVDKPIKGDVEMLRQNLAEAAANSLKNIKSDVYSPKGPFEVTVNMRDGEKVANKIRHMWQLSGNNDLIVFKSENHRDMYWMLLKIAYLNPFIEKHISFCLKAMNMLGWAELKVCKFLK